MRTTVIIAAVVVTIGFGSEHGARAGSARPRVRRVKAAIARHIPAPVKATLTSGLVRLQRARRARAGRRDLRRGQALADVKRHGTTKLRTMGDLRYSPAVHGVASTLVMLGLGFQGAMAAIGGGVVYLSSRSAKKTSDGWLALENRSIDVLERDGPAAVKQRFSRQGAKNPDASLERLQQNRHLRNGSYR